MNLSYTSCWVRSCACVFLFFPFDFLTAFSYPVQSVIKNAVSIVCIFQIFHLLVREYENCVCELADCILYLHCNMGQEQECWVKCVVGFPWDHVCHLEFCCSSDECIDKSFSRCLSKPLQSCSCTDQSILTNSHCADKALLKSIKINSRLSSSQGFEMTCHAA